MNAILVPPPGVTSWTDGELKNAQRIRYTTEHAKTIKAFHRSDAFLRGLMGPFGSGKSTSCITEIIKRAMQQAPGADGVRRTRWAVVRKTYPQLQDTTQRTFFSWFPHETFGNFHDSKHNYTITRMPSPDGIPMVIEIMFRALELEKHVENLLSLELTGAWINEARDFPISIVNGLMGRVGRYPAVKDGGPTWYGVIADTNPPDDESWWYRLFEETDLGLVPEKLREKIKRDKFLELFKQPSGRSEQAENLPNLMPGYYDTLAALNPPDWVKVYVDAEYGFIQDGRPVYPEYIDSMHCRKLEPIKGIPIYRGWDFGLSPAVVFAQVLPNGVLLIFDELVSTNISLDEFCPDVATKSNRDYAGFTFQDVGDPAGNSTSALDKELRTSYDIARVHGFAIEASSCGNDIKIRTESVRSGLNRLRGGVPGIVVHPRCRVTRKGFQGRYRYRKLQTGEDRYNPKPEKDQYSHPQDAAQYIAVKVLGKSITTSPLPFGLPQGYNTDFNL